MLTFIKKGEIIFTVILFTVFSCSRQRTTEINYFDQSPPGITPEVFAPGIISSKYHEHSSLNFSPDGKELMYTLSCEHGHTIMYAKFINGEWSEPQPISFSGEYSDDSHVWSNDGSGIYFMSKRPCKPDTSGGVYNNWYVEKVNDKWGEPELNNFFAYSFSTNGNNYIHLENDTSGWDICYSKPETNYLETIKLDSDINSVNADATPFIAPDESYLIFASMGRKDAIGIMDLYISFKNEDGTWGKAVNMGEPINLPGHISRFPRVSPDGKFLFYWSNINNGPGSEDSMSKTEELLQKYNPKRPKNGKDGDIYWVSMEIIKGLKAN